MRWLVLSIAVVFVAAPAGAAGSIKAAPPGRVAEAADGSGPTELVTLAPEVAASLLATAPETSLRIEDWPTAPGVRKPIVVTRHDVYAADARIVVIDKGQETEVPRSRLVFFWGSVEGDGASTVVLWADPDTHTVAGSASSDDGSYELSAPGAGRPSLVAKQSATGSFHCGLEDLPKGLIQSRAPGSAAASSTTPQALSSLYAAVVAVDTDNEFMSIKFGNNSTLATNYIAQLFAGVDAIYERDLFIRLNQGFTVLRPSTTPDPYIVNSNSNASGDELSEVSAYWGNPGSIYTGVKRTLVAMLSGKQPGGGWSGIAWIGALCDPYFGVSFSQVLTTGTSAGTQDFQLVGHEMGHNFGSPHTHCTDTDANAANGIQPIDFCYSAECGSLWTPNPGVSCPVPFTINPVNGGAVTGVKGTLMSYCHLLAGCGVTNVFHPLTISLTIAAEIDQAVNAVNQKQCVFPSPTVTSISPVNGGIAGGTAVTIKGTNFVAPATVTLGGVAATSVVVTDPNTITAITPAHALGPVDLVVSVSSTNGFAPLTAHTLPSAFAYTGLSVTAIGPNSGTTAGGAAVAISGTGFVASATVTIGGVAATAVNVINPSTLTAVTPAHATGTVDVAVSIPGPQTATLPASYFYFTPSVNKFFTLGPCRLVDTRTSGIPLAPSSRQNFTITGAPCNVPSSAKAVSVILTVTQPLAPGYLSLFPGNGVASLTSNVNFGIGQTRANNSVVLMSTDGLGTLAVYNGAAGTVHLILDVNGYFQ